MNHHDHTLSSGCWCAPIIGRHVQGSQIFDYWRDPDRLAELGITQNVVVSPEPPTIPNPRC